MGQPQAAPVGAVADLLYPRDARLARKASSPPASSGARKGSRSDTASGSCGAALTLAPRAQRARRLGEDLADRGIELADALKAGRERDAADRHVGGLEQDARRLRALGAGEREGAHADAPDQLSVDVALGVAKPASQAADALPIDDAVGDQSHRPADEVGTTVPLGRAGAGVRPTALAGPEPGCLSRGGGRVEADVLAFRSARRAARAAVDPGGADTAEEPAVEARVTGGGRLPTTLGVENHGDIVARLYTLFGGNRT